MLKIIHTADWHLGQTFFGYDRNKEHECFLNWLKGQIQILDVDVLLIAGDVFDSPNPSAESQKLYYRFLHDVTKDNPDLQIIIIAGNHDSAARLEAPSPLLNEMNITVRGVIRKLNNGIIDYDSLIIPLWKNGSIEAYCLAVPYLRQGDYPSADDYASGVQTFYAELRKRSLTLNKKIIAMGHLQTTGADVSVDDRSERVIIGGLEAVSASTFTQGFIYTALGHLHRCQQIAGCSNIRYAGAPLPMSFAEKNYKQGVLYVELDPVSDNIPEIRKLEYDSMVKLISIPDRELEFEDVLNEIEQLPVGSIDETSPYLEIKVRISEPNPMLKYKIQTALENKNVRLARISAIYPSKIESSYKFISSEELQSISPLNIAQDYYRQKYEGREMPDDIKNLLEDVVREVVL